MADTTKVSVDAGRPDPATATTSAEFVESMRSLKRWTGLGFRQLEKRATAGGHVLPRSTLTVALSRDTLPREDLISAFVNACGCDEDETARWVAARRRIAAAGDTETLTPEETPAETEPPARPVKRRANQLLRVVAAFVAAAAAVTYFVGWGSPSSPNNPRQAPDRAAPETPGMSRDRTPAQESSTTPTPVTPSSTATPVNQGEVAPAAVDTSAPAEPPPSQNPGPPPTQTAPPKEWAPDHVTIPLPGEAPIECPMPYLVTGYGPIAQCTQQVGDKARVGLYSPVTGDFGPQTGWLDVIDGSWYHGEVRATDDIVADARGYAVLNTPYAGAVWATQYRDGEGRWGRYNVYTNQFYPSENGWQPLP